MDGSHQTLNDSELIVNDLGQWRKAVGGAGRVGNLKNYDENGHVGGAHCEVKTHDCVLGVI